MKRSEYLKALDSAIEMMFDSCGDETPIGKMFSKTMDGEFTSEDMKRFLLSPYLNNHKDIYCFFWDSDGTAMKKELFIDNCSNILLAWFSDKGYTKETTYEEAFPYKTITNPECFKELAEVIVEVIERFGRPPLFHKTQDRILRFDWEKES